MAVKFYVKGSKELKSELKKLEKVPRTVLNRTMSDIKKRAPSWVAAEVAGQYGIKKQEVGDGETSTLKVVGNSINDVALVYRGRVLTPTHFGMSPKAPKEGAYTLKATIVKGKRTTLGKVKKLTKKQRAALGKNFRREGTRKSDHSPIMLMAPKGVYIPFQRKSTNRKDVEAIKTLSVPQMIDNRAAPHIHKAIGENLQKRVEHHMRLFEK